jgi:hypothetical protein
MLLEVLFLPSGSGIIVGETFDYHSPSLVLPSSALFSVPYFITICDF